METHNYNNTSFEVPTLTYGLPFKIDKCFPYEDGISVDTSRWNPRFFKGVQNPRVIDKARSNVVVKHRILDCPIKFPGSDKIRIPNELLLICPEIMDVVQYEIDHNNYFDEYYAYVTTDYSFVKKGETQRKAGCHIDGYQGTRTSKNERINRSYTYSSCDPTEFFLHGFDISNIDDSKYNVFHYMDKVADESKIWQPKPWEIVLMNVYNVHRSAVAKEDGHRFFFRLTFDTRKFDRLGNTHNPMFNYKWDMVARDTQKDLLDL